MISRRTFVSSAFGLAATATLAACGGESNTSADASTKKLSIAASPSPHAEILTAFVAPLLAEQDITLEVLEFTDYVQPNVVVENGEIDCNYFQHINYLDNYNEENGTTLVSAGSIHYEPFGLYPGKVATIEELPDGATIAIPNDGTNEARALLLLEAQGLIKLKEDVGLTATILDIVENPKGLNIVEVEAAQIPRSLPDVDMAVINGNYAIQAGLSVGKDAVATEDAESEAAQTYANILVVKEGNENDEGIQALVKALQSEAVKQFIIDTYDGAVVPMF